MEAQIFLVYLTILEAAGYQVLKELGEGAQAQVVLVKQGNAYMACKISRDVVRLKAEAELLKGLRHPGVPRYLGWREYGAWAFLLMEYVEGDSMAQYLCQALFIPLVQIYTWGRELAEVLCALHDMAGTIIYRDLKPENIMIRRDGRLKLLDLGCACVCEQAGKSRAGTPAYAAPEQFNKPQSVNESSDAYTWGKIMEALLEKCVPESLREYLLLHRIKRLIGKCCSPKIEERPVGMRMLLDDLVEIWGDNRAKVLSKDRKLSRNAQK